MIDVKDR